jgi:hypothetical protein
MRRRDLLAGLLATTTASTVCAQQSSSKVWRVALFYPGTIGDAEREVLGAFYSELGSRGYIEGKNLILDVRELTGGLNAFRLSWMSSSRCGPMSSSQWVTP